MPGIWFDAGGSTMSDAEVKAAYEANADTNAFDDAEQSKLAAIEASATADQTGAEIKSAYEAEANAFTDTKNTKLTGIETSATADQSNAEIRTAVGAATDSNVFDDAAVSKLGAIEASADVTDAANVAAAGGAIISSGAGAPSSTPAVVGDIYVDTTADISYVATGVASSADWDQATGAGGGDLLAANNLGDVASAATSFTNIKQAASTTATGVAELATITEVNTGTDAARVVTPAGLAGSALQTKVDGIEASATADQSGAQIKTAYQAEANAFTDAQFTKLGAIEASADVTDVTNVTAAGAVMSPEFADTVFRVQDNGDATKQIAFQASGITTGNTRTITMPDADVTLGGGLSGTDGDVISYQPLLYATDGRSKTLTYTGDDLTQVLEKNGATTVKQTDLTYTGTKLTGVVELADGVTVTTTLTYTGDNLTSTGRVVT